MYFKSVVLSLLSRIVLALGATAGIAAAEPSATLSADAWLTRDLIRQTVTIHQPPPMSPVQFRIPHAVGLDLNVDAATLCGRDTDSMWRMDVVGRRLKSTELSDESPYRYTRHIAASHNGACAALASDTELLVLDPSGSTTTVHLALPAGVQALEWRSLAYDDNHAMFLLTGAQGYALIPADRLPTNVQVRQASGKVEQGSIANTHFSGFRCCARLGRDGETLYSVANIGDDHMNGFTGLVAIDVESAQYERLHLPFSPNWYETGRRISRFDHPWFTLAGSTDYELWTAASGTQLMLSGFADLDNQEDVQSILTVSIESGDIQAVPRRKDETFIGVSHSGRYLLWRDAEDNTVITDADHKEVARHPGLVVAVAHARSKTTGSDL